MVEYALLTMGGWIPDFEHWFESGAPWYFFAAGRVVVVVVVLATR